MCRDDPPRGACIISAGDADLARASAQLAAGGLVAFPTETVYGLGANALNPKAAARIFEVKGRPAHDPLIVHVLEWDDAAKLVKGSATQRDVAASLARQLWPGPLTMVLPAEDCIPSLIHANSEWVGVRSPAHPVARKLLAACQLPLAAPSANRFNHVSPTLPEHVTADLEERDPSLLVVDGGASSVGIESTVLKVHDDHLEILRCGAVTRKHLEDALAAEKKNFRITERDTHSKPKKMTEVMEGPGQMLTHYAPNIPAFLFDASQLPAPAGAVVRGGAVSCALDEVLVIDFCGAAASLQRACMAYKDLSASGSADEAAAALFATLRWSEGFPDAQCVLLPSLAATETDLVKAIKDRLFRAASGVRALVAPSA